MNKTNKAALYIHIPFCRQKCLYCDFASFAGMEKYMVDYTKALCKEMDNYKEREFSTVFIGGGTPTYLSLEALALLRDSFLKLKISSDAEFTVEANPGTFTKEKLELFKEMGMNRLSIGLQSFDDNLLKTIGRIHSVEEFKKSYFMARESGIDNINIDLMFGLPNQSLDKWLDTLEEAVKLKPEHLSSYSLIIEEGTPFYNLYEKNLLSIPDEDIERDMYIQTKDVLKKHGYIQYEISNYAKEGRQCKHNLVYWNLQNYIGCGLAAHSYNNKTRYYNTSSISEYIEMINDKGSAILERCKNTIEDDMEEFMFLGLRKLEGIDISIFEKRFQKNIFDIYSKVIDKYMKLNLLEREGNKIRLTAKGIELSNMVMVEFLIDREK
ncbi:MAG: radical SAM family heme chaperone HemW [Clostridium sp.]